VIRHRAPWLFVAAMAAAAACTTRDAGGDRANQKELELGPHRVSVSAPAGWEVLDQGSQKRFRKGESEIVLQNLGKTDWERALASLHDDRRREVKSRSPISIDNHEAMEIETWNRLDHAWPQRMLFVRADEDLLALQTTRLADAETVKAFESIRDSLHFSVSVRR
jgi:hypothetical protein